MESPKKGIQIVSIVGTSRPGNFTTKAVDLVNDELGKAGVEVTTIDPAMVELNFPGQPVTEGARELQRAVEGATGVVLLLS